MTLAQDSAAARAGHRVAAKPVVPVLLACLAILAFAPFWQQRWGTIPDTSWLITVCERLLAGERLYVDIIETNPPFSVWMYLPAVAGAKFLGIPPETAVGLYFSAVVLAGLAFAARITRLAGFAEARTLFLLLPLLLALFIIFPGNAFSEREHYGVVLLLPMLVLTAWRADPTAVSLPDIKTAVLAGLCASAIVLVKPHYAIVIATPALYLAWRKRSVRPLVGPEYLAGGAVCGIGLAAILAFHPEFVDDIFPILADTYLRVKRYEPIFVQYGPAYGVLVGLLWLIRPRLAFSPLVIVALLASVSALVPLIHMAKGWPYHAYPAFALAMVALACRIAQPDPRTPAAPRLSMVQAILLATVTLVSWIPFSKTQKPEADLVSAIKGATVAPSVAVIGVDMAIGHPLTRMVGGRWLSAHCSDWLGAFAYHFEQQARLAGDLATADHYQRILNDYIGTKRAEFDRERPDLLLVQKNDEAWLAPMFADLGFDQVMANYEFLAEGRDVAAYIRIDYERPDTP